MYGGYEEDFFKFRKQNFEKTLEDISDLVSGYSLSYKEFISDGAGKITHEGLHSFIQSLLQVYDHYTQYKDKKALEGKQREYVECFLYCTIQGVAYQNGFVVGGRLNCGTYPQASTFRDILNMADKLGKLSWYWEQDWVRNFGLTTMKEGLSRGFDFLNMTFELITGDTVLAIHSQEELDEYARQMEELDRAMEEFVREVEDEMGFPSEEEKMKAAGFCDIEEYRRHEREKLEEYTRQRRKSDLEEARAHGFDSYREYMEACRESWWEDKHPDEVKFLKMAYAYYDRLDEGDWEPLPWIWEEDLINPEEYVDRYIRFRELYKDEEVEKELGQLVKIMVDAFLYENHLSGFSYGDGYGLITYRLERSLKQLELEMRKAGEYR